MRNKIIEITKEYVDSDPPVSTDDEPVEPTKHICAAKNMPALCLLLGKETFKNELKASYKKLASFE